MSIKTVRTTTSIGLSLYLFDMLGLFLLYFLETSLILVVLKLFVVIVLIYKSLGSVWF